jgi:hypothetical protein
VRLLRWKNDGFKPKAYARGWPALATRLFSRGRLGDVLDSHFKQR